MAADTDVLEPEGEFVEIDDADESDVEDTEDGGAIVKLDDEAPKAGDSAFYENLAETLPREELDKLEATTTKLEWGDVVNEIMDARNGKIPDDWFAVIIVSGLINRKMEQFRTWHSP